MREPQKGRQRRGFSFCRAVPGTARQIFFFQDQPLNGVKIGHRPVAGLGGTGAGLKILQQTSVPAQRPPPPLALVWQGGLGTSYAEHTSSVVLPQLSWQVPHSLSAVSWA